MTAGEAAAILGPDGEIRVRTEGPTHVGGSPVWVGSIRIGDSQLFEARNDELGRVLIDVMTFLGSLAAAEPA